MKTFRIHLTKGIGAVEVSFPAIGAGIAANSFSLYGCTRWQAFEGDWYDAALIYRNFVHKYAKWLPTVGKNGRDDTPNRFMEVAFWIADYIPNSLSQRDVRPMQLAAVSDRYPKDYWYTAPIELRRRLGVLYTTGKVPAEEGKRQLYAPCRYVSHLPPVASDYRRCCP